MRRQLARAAVQLLRVGAPEASTPAASCRWAAEPSAFQSLLQAASSCRHHGTPGSAAGGAAARLPLRALATQTAGRPATPAEKVELSDSAVQRLQDLQRKSSEPVVLRLTVEGGGCSGFQYEFSIDSSAKNGDRVFERDGATVVMDDVSFEFLKGATVDFESDLMRSAFVVQTNPNAASSCGCGSSFVAKQ